MIEKILPSTATKLRILKEIYENPGINLSEIISRAKTSPNIVLKYVNELAKYGVIKERRVGGNKKIHLRNFWANLESDIGVLIFSFVEIDKKYAFLEKYPKFKPFLKQLEDLFKDTMIEFCLVYGSFARFSAIKESDVDVLIVGRIGKEMEKRIGEIFVTLERGYSIKVESLKEFVDNVRKGDPLHQSILKEHVVIWNEEKFIRCLGSRV